jgi:hypothetical protein
MNARYLYVCSWGILIAEGGKQIAAFVGTKLTDFVKQPTKDQRRSLKLCGYCML